MRGGNVCLLFTDSQKGWNHVFILILTYPDIDECEVNPCENGGTCVNSPPGSYTCNCAEGYKGDHCQEGKNN